MEEAQNKLQTAVLEALEEEFGHEQGAWTISDILSSILHRKGVQHTIPELVQTVEEMAKRRLVEWHPTSDKGVIDGFSLRLTIRGYTMLEYGVPSLTGRN